MDEDEWKEDAEASGFTEERGAAEQAVKTDPVLHFALRLRAANPHAAAADVAATFN